jgi:hypothetical protein
VLTTFFFSCGHPMPEALRVAAAIEERLISKIAMLAATAKILAGIISQSNRFHSGCSHNPNFSTWIQKSAATREHLGIVSAL